MSFLHQLRYRLRLLLGRDRFEQEREEEWGFHLSLETLQQRAARADLSPEEAQLAAQRRFGNRTWLEEETRQMAGLGFIEVVRQDLRFALRSFRRTPGFTAIAVLTLAIGIGANTAIFSAVNTLLLRPLPFDRPEQLMKVSLTIDADGPNPAEDDVVWSAPKFDTFRTLQTAFADASILTEIRFTVRSEGEAVREYGEITDEHLLPTLHVQPALGRNFTPEETLVGGPGVVLIADHYWRTHFNADPAILGKALNLEGSPRTVIGVLPPGFRGLSGRAELWTPIAAQWGKSIHEPRSHAFTGLARRKAGVTADQAKAVVATVGRRVDATYPREAGDPHWGAIARELDATRINPAVRQSLLVLFGAVGLVLLIACANVANLFLIRATGRRREIAVRLAIGAGRGRLIRQLLTESLLLSLLAAVASLAIAWVGVRLLSTIDPASALRGQELGGIGAVNFTGIRLDPLALGFTALLALGTGLLFGLIPALQATRPQLTQALNNGGGWATRWRGITSRNVLAVVEIALALVLLTGSGLVLRSLGRLMAVDPGFVPAQVLTLRLNTEAARDSLPAMYDAMLARLGALPGVTSVGLSDCLPLSGGCNGTVMWQRDRPPTAAGREAIVGVHWMTPGWLTVMQIPLLKGRNFDAGDRLGARKAVLVSATAASRYWPGEDPVGRPVSVGQGGFSDDTAYVVGVVGDVRYESVDALAKPDVYLPYYQSPRSAMIVHLRTAGDPVTIAAAARRTLQEFLPDTPIYDIRTMTSRVSEAMAYARFSALLLGMFAAVALALATMGTYGVISFGVAQRTQELGIRSALGASRWDVVRLVARQGAVIALVGGLIGLGGAFALTRLLGAMLYEVPPADPLTFGATAVVMAVAVALASLVPARRAANVPPAQALRKV